MPDTFHVRDVPCSIDLEGEGDRAIVEAVPPEGGAVATIIFQCDYNIRFSLIAALRGSVIAVGQSIVRIPPWAYPPSPNLVCTSISEVSGIKAWVDSFGYVNYYRARVVANFSVPVYQFESNDPGDQNDPSGDPWTVTKTKTTSEVFSPPKGAFYSGPFPGGKPVEEGSIGFVRTKTEISILRKYLPFHPLDTVEQMSGKVNRDPFRIGQRTYQPGFVLFLTAENEPSVDPVGNPTQDVTFQYIANTDYDWNTYMTSDGSWQKLNSRADGSGVSPFQPGDLEALRF